MKIRNMTYAGVSAVFIALCSWISIPAAVPFTLQTFGIFLVMWVLGGRRGTQAVLIYILLGVIGLPVFSGFSGGPSALLNTTGGYILGFLLTALSVWAGEKLAGKRTSCFIISSLTGLTLCYLFGTLWFMYLYAKSSGTAGFLSVLSLCVIPFIIPDLLKLALAVAAGRRIKKLMGDLL